MINEEVEMSREHWRTKAKETKKKSKRACERWAKTLGCVFRNQKVDLDQYEMSTCITGTHTPR